MNILDTNHANEQVSSTREPGAIRVLCALRELSEQAEYAQESTLKLSEFSIALSDKLPSEIADTDCAPYFAELLSLISSVSEKLRTITTRINAVDI